MILKASLYWESLDINIPIKSIPPPKKKIDICAYNWSETTLYLYYNLRTFNYTEGFFMKEPEVHVLYTTGIRYNDIIIIY